MAALVISAAVIIMQSAGLSTLHSSVQQAATLLPDYGKLRRYAWYCWRWASAAGYVR